MLPIRVFFEKKGCAAYISHLDVQRAVIRALQRTGCDFAFTEGFNPHMKLVFAMPLSLFQESTYEIFDVTLLDDNETYPEVLEKRFSCRDHAVCRRRTGEKACLSESGNV